MPATPNAGLIGTLAANLTETDDSLPVDRRLLRSINARHLRDALRHASRPHTVLDLLGTLEGPVRRPGEGARLLRAALRQVARQRPELELDQLATELANARGPRRRPA
jgi:hypothetical protein